MSLDSLDVSDLQSVVNDKDFQELLVAHQQVQIQARIHRLNDICWDKCVTGKPSSKLDSYTETCLTNCVARFLDSSEAIAQRFKQLVQKHS